LALADYGGSSSHGYGGRSGGFSDSARNAYPEYDAGDDEELPRRSSITRTSGRQSGRQGSVGSSATIAKNSNPAPPPKAPEVDLLGGFDDEVAPTKPEKSLPPTGVAATGASGGGGAASANVNVMDSLDDFGDFEAAPQPQSQSQPQIGTTAQAPLQPQSQVQSGKGKGNLFDLLGQNGSAGVSVAASVPSMNHSRQLSGGLGGNALSSPPLSAGMGINTGSTLMSPTFINAPRRTSSHMSTGSSGGMLSPTLQSSAAQAPKPTQAAGKSTAGGFEDLWSMSLGSSASQKKPNASAGKSIQELEREKTQKGLWGAQPTNIASSSNTATKTAPPPGNGGFGSFASGGDDNLLL